VNLGAFYVVTPNRLWVADITFVPTAAGFLFLAVVLEAWSRKIVGWAMANHLRTELVLDAYRAATNSSRVAMLIRLISAPDGDHRRGTFQARQCVRKPS